MGLWSQAEAKAQQRRDQLLEELRASQRCERGVDGKWLNMDRVNARQLHTSDLSEQHSVRSSDRSDGCNAHQLKLLEASPTIN